MQGTTTRNSSSAAPSDARAAKARLFGDETSDRLHKQVIKARFLRNLQQPTGGLETQEASETATVPNISHIPETPVKVGRYAILRKLGQGGMGVVYVAYDEDLDRRVAIKLLRGELVKDDRGRARMLREAQALGRLSHPNVVQVHEVGQWNDLDYVAMEFVDGQTLDRWIAERDRSWREILDVLCEAGRGLEAAHAAGLVHRDFKPANLLIARDGRARVLDFGLARSVNERDTNPRGAPIIDLVETAEHSVISESRPDESVASSSSSSTSAFDKLLTVTGALLGTPAYMAPEQHLGQPATALSDQFSFCVVLYEALFGQRPFKGGSRTEYAVRVTEGEFEAPPVNSGVPLWLRKIVLRGLSPKPEDRWPSMTALLGELRRDRTRTWRGVAVAAGLLAAFGVALSVSGSAEAKLCELDPGSVTDTWGSEQREAVRVAFGKVGMHEADAVLEHATASLDRYADELVGARSQACEARWVERTQTDAQLELRTACLDQRERELAAVVDVLADADRDVILHAPELVAGLGDVGLCSRVDLLEEGTPAPKDAATVAKIAEVRGTIAEANAARDVGRQAEARALAARALRSAEQIGFEPLLGEVYNLESRLARIERDFKAAREYSVRAATISQRHQSLELAAKAWLNLSFIAAEAGGDPNAIIEFRVARGAIDRIGSADHYLALLGLARGVSLRNAGRHDDALVEFGAALRLTESGWFGSELVVSELLVARAGTLVWLGRTSEARVDLDRVLDTRGVLNRVQTDALFELAVAELNAGQLEEAERDMREAMRGYEELFGPDYDSIGHAHLVLTKLALRRDDVRAAEREVESALTILDEDHLDHGWALDARADVQKEGGDLLAAVESLNAAMAHAQRTSASDAARLAYLSGRLGEALSDAGQLDQAIVEFDRSIAYFERDSQSAPLDVARALLGRGRARLAQDKPGLAVGSLERAVELATLDCGDDWMAGVSRLELAETLARLGERADEQKVLVAEAAELLVKFPSGAAMLERAEHLTQP